jgi:acyl-coenzyme A thioesterase PaaI-like protein
MPFDVTKIVDVIEGVSPKLSRRVTMLAISLLSPFNGHLKSKLVEWTKSKIIVELSNRRGIRNHVGGIHAGALFTLGESCAGLLLVKNFPFDRYRPLMSKVAVEYKKQARSTVYGHCEIAKKTLTQVKEDLKKKKIPYVSCKTVIKDKKGQEIAVVQTTWQLKLWSEVKGGYS